MAASAKIRPLKLLRVFRVKGFEKSLVLYVSLPDGVEIPRVVHGSRNLEALMRREGLERVSALRHQASACLRVARVSLDLANLHRMPSGMRGHQQ
jgi:hypothetical protein